MSELHLILKSLNKKDLKRLQENIDSTTKKGNLLSIFLSNNDSNDSFLAKELGYDEHSSSFATLKHRFIDEIADILFENDPNPLVQINQRIAALRSSIYSAHDLLFEHELNRCYKTAKRLEAFEALYLVLKLKLVYAKRGFSSSGEVNKIKKELEHIQNIKQIINLVETSFFSNLFDYNINLFHITQEDFLAVNNILEPIQQEFGNYKTVSFLIRSLQIEMEIKSPKEINPEISTHIDDLIHFYEGSLLQNKYPMAEIGLYAMQNKFQFLTNQKNHFKNTFQIIWNNIPKIADKNMYLGVNIYLLFIIHYQYKEHNLTKQELENGIGFFMRSKHPLMHTAIHFFKACQYYNSRNFVKAYSEIIKSRQHLNLHIRLHTFFPMEISILGIICQLKEENISEASLAYETNALRYCLSKMSLENNHPVYKLLNLARKSIKKNNISAGLQPQINQIIEQLQKEKVCLLLQN